MKGPPHWRLLCYWLMESVCRGHLTGSCSAIGCCCQLTVATLLEAAVLLADWVCLQGSPHWRQPRSPRWPVYQEQSLVHLLIVECELLWKSSDLQGPSSTGQCSLTALRANTNSLPLANKTITLVCLIVQWKKQDTVNKRHGSRNSSSP